MVRAVGKKSAFADAAFLDVAGEGECRVSAGSERLPSSLAMSEEWRRTVVPDEAPGGPQSAVLRHSVAGTRREVSIVGFVEVQWAFAAVEMFGGFGVI